LLLSRFANNHTSQPRPNTTTTTQIVMHVHFGNGQYQWTEKQNAAVVATNIVPTKQKEIDRSTTNAKESKRNELAR
jgi:hypothetical protein